MADGSSELHRTAERVSEPTRQLRAAAHLNPWAIRSAIKAWDDEKFAARAPEYFLDIDVIRQDMKEALRRESMFKTIMFVLGCIFIAVIVDDGYRYGSLLDPFYVIGKTIELLTPVILPAAFTVAIRDYFKLRYVRKHDFSMRPNDLEPLGETAHEQNVVVSSGETPFVGAGADIGGWSFTLDLNAPAEGSAGSPQTLTIEAFYDEVTDEVRELSLPGLEVQDQLFANGRDLRGTPEILPAHDRRPLQKVGEAEVRKHFGQLDEHVRHYRVFRLPSWGGQMMLSVFFRATRVGDGLFVEARQFLLPPVSTTYRGVDELPASMKFGEIPGYLLISALKAPFLMVRCWFSVTFSILKVLGAITSAFSFTDEDKQEREAVLSNPAYDHGARRSLREQFSDQYSQRHFQKIDGDMYVKLLQKQIIAAIEGALSKRGISTADIGERRTTILNHGVMVTGGNVQTEGLAVGAGAKVIADRASDAVKPIRDRIRSL